VKKKNKTIIGWEEWCKFPELELCAIKAKVDTGAKTSCLHAFNIGTFTKNDKKYVQFYIHPIQKNKKIVRKCISEVVDYRYVTNSGGIKEKRYVIKTQLILAGKDWEIELTLAKRDSMAFRMLLGREAIRKAKFLVDPSKSCFHGKLKPQQIKNLYTEK